MTPIHLALALIAADGAAPASPKAVVAAMFDAFNRHDAEAVARLYAKDAKLTSSDFCKPRGRADVARSYAELFRQFPDIRDAVVVMIAEGNRVAVRFQAVSEKAGMTLPIQAMIQVRDGLIVTDDSVFDNGGQPCR